MFAEIRLTEFRQLGLDAKPENRFCNVVTSANSVDFEDIIKHGFAGSNKVVFCANIECESLGKMFRSLSVNFSYYYSSSGF
tara:strand:- start:150246 stop:150488 length:243 start_codon:yes stop_codon:yes gene_type:complete